MGSVRRRGDAVRVTLDRDEAMMLALLVREVLELLDTEGPATDPEDSDDPLEQLLETSAGVESPRDPVLRRLLPDAYEDPEAAEEFRRFTDAELRATKRGALRQVETDLAAAAEAGGRTGAKVRLSLTEDAAALWLPALTDLRLSLGTRLDVREDMAAELRELQPGSRRHAELAAYDWLSWLQDALVRALGGG